MNTLPPKIMRAFQNHNDNKVAHLLLGIGGCHKHNLNENSADTQVIKTSLQPLPGERKAGSEVYTSSTMTNSSSNERSSVVSRRVSNVDTSSNGILRPSSVRKSCDLLRHSKRRSKVKFHPNTCYHVPTFLQKFDVIINIPPGQSSMSLIRSQIGNQIYNKACYSYQSADGPLDEDFMMHLGKKIVNDILKKGGRFLSCVKSKTFRRNLEGFTFVEVPIWRAVRKTAQVLTAVRIKAFERFKATIQSMKPSISTLYSGNAQVYEKIALNNDHTVGNSNQNNLSVDKKMTRHNEFDSSSDWSHGEYFDQDVNNVLNSNLLKEKKHELLCQIYSRVSGKNLT